MAKNTKQIALIQNRHGKVNELPKQLSTGEFGFADDTNQLFIGNDGHPTLKERLNSNVFPYGNVEILSEFSDNTKLIKYSPYMNGNRIYFPKGVTPQRPYTNVEVGQTIKLNNQLITFHESSPLIVIPDNMIGMSTSFDIPFDYLILEYYWDGDGNNLNIDLDTDTRIIGNALFEGKSVGYGNGSYGNQKIDTTDDEQYKINPRGIPYGSSCANSYIYYGGDIQKLSTNSGVNNEACESILINAKNIFSSSDVFDFWGKVKIKLSAKWFSEDEGNNVKLKIKAYKNGSVELNSISNKFEVIGGEQVELLDSSGAKKIEIDIDITNIPSKTETNYKEIGKLIINKNTKNAYLALNNNTTTSDDTTNNTTYLSLDEVINQINLADVNVDAVNNNGSIVLRTIEDDLLIENSENSALYNLGFDTSNLPSIETSDPILKRTLQEVLDDRYSIKSFNVLGNGATDDSKNINNALIILYNYAKSDRKELFFPADTYMIGDNTDNEGNPLLLMSNTHLKGEGIDRTIIKSYNNNLLITADSNTVESGNTNYCKNGGKEPSNILIEDMTFEVNNHSALILGDSNNITFRNCKFKGNSDTFVQTVSNSKLNNIIFDNVIFEGNANEAIVINGILDNMIINNCFFKDINNHVIELNGINLNNISDDTSTENESSDTTTSDVKIIPSIKNVIISNNIFENCSSISKTLIYVDNAEYVNVIKSMVDERVLTEVDTNNELIYTVLNRKVDENNRFIDNNYCDSPIITTDTNKYLRFNYYQDVYDYVQALYNKYGHLGLELINPQEDSIITNYLQLKLGDKNDDKLIISSTSQAGDFFINTGKNADIHIGDEIKILEWQANYPYSILDIVKYTEDEDEDYINYMRIDTYTEDEDIFDKNKWYELDKLNDFNDKIIYNINDCVIYNDKIYKCLEDNVTGIFDSSVWEPIGNSSTYIKFYKNIDTNDKYITNSQGDVKFKVKKGNTIKVDYDSDISYSKAIGNDPNNLATVGYVNEGLSGISDLQLDDNGINEKVGKEESSEISLYDFNESYGDNIYLKEVSVNVRQIFVPITEQIKSSNVSKCGYIVWNNLSPKELPIQYYVGDVVKYNNNDYICIETNRGIEPTNTIYWKNINSINQNYNNLNNGKISHNENDLVIYNTIDDIDAHIDRYYRCIKNEEINVSNWYSNENYLINDIVIHNNIIYLCAETHISTSFDSDMENGYWVEYSLDRNYWVEIIKDDDDNWIQKGKSNLSWYKGDVVKINFDGNIPEDDRYYICIKNHTSTVNDDTEENYLEECFENDKANGCWKKIKIERNNGEITNPADVKYVSIKSVDNNIESTDKEEDKWLFDLNDVNLLERNANGIEIPVWRENHSYHIGDKASYNYSNYVCLLDYESSSGNENEIRQELHDANLWKKLNESGFNYIFHFEKDLYINSNNGNRVILEPEDYMFRHNFAYHNLKLCFYDANKYPLKLIDNDMDSYLNVNLWQPNKTYYINQYICPNWICLDSDEYEWIGDVYYDVGSYVKYNNNYYKCLTANQDENFEVNKWELLEKSNFINFNLNNNYNVGDTVKYRMNNVDRYYICNKAITAASDFYNEKYIVLTTFTSESEFSINVNEITVLQKVNEIYWKENTNYYKNQYIGYTDTSTNKVIIYQANKNFSSENKNIYDIIGIDRELTMIPSKSLQISPSGALLVNIEYNKG